MRFEKLLDLAKKDFYRASKEMMSSVNHHDLKVLASKIADLKEQEIYGTECGKVDDILKILIDYTDYRLEIPEEYHHERWDVYNNAFVQGVLMNYYTEPQMTPSVTYEWCIEKLAEKLRMPKMKEDPVTLQRLAKRLKVKDVSLVRRDGQFRMIASQGSGINTMRVGKGKDADSKYERPKLPIYDLAYIEVIAILKSVSLKEKEKNADDREFWGKVKDWGKRELLSSVKVLPSDLLDQYIQLKIKEDESMAYISNIDYINSFLLDMADVHERYSDFISSGKIGKNMMEDEDAQNNKFYFYLYLIYAYVYYHSAQDYRYLALYSLEHRYLAGTIIGIVTQGIWRPFFAEYIPTAKYALPYQEDPISDTVVWTMRVRDPVGENERREREAANSKNMFYIHKICIHFYFFLFRLARNIILDKEMKKSFDKNLLAILNSGIARHSKGLGMLPDKCHPGATIDFYLWFLYRLVILDPKCQKDTKRFFEKLGSKEELLSFLYDWYSALDEREIGEMVDEIERFGTDSEQKKIDDIIKRIHKRSNCDMIIDMIRKMIKDKEKRDEAEDKKRQVKEILNFMHDQRILHKQNNYQSIVTLLKKHKLNDSQDLNDSIISQIRKTKNLGKTLEKIRDGYLEDVLEAVLKDGLVNGVKETNKKMGIKVESHSKLMRNIYCDVRIESYDERTRAVLKKYGLSFFTPLLQEEHIQPFMGDIFRKGWVNKHDLQYYFTYLRKAAWLPEDTVKVIRHCKECNTNIL